MAIIKSLTRSFLRHPLPGSWVLLYGLLLASVACADTPATFDARYEARYGSFRASAERTLAVSADNHIEMNTRMALKLFGKTISAITEHSELESLDDGERLLPLSYTFIQTGLGKRRRQIDFDWQQAMATAVVKNSESEIVLDGPVLDNLSSYLEIRRQLMAGNTDIHFPVIDKGEKEEQHFRVLGEERVATAGGELDTVRLEKVRDENSDRHTEIWLATDWDYLLVKLVQEEPGSSTIRLDLKQATVGERPVFLPESEN